MRVIPRSFRHGVPNRRIEARTRAEVDQASRPALLSVPTGFELRECERTQTEDSRTLLDRIDHTQVDQAESHRLLAHCELGR